MAIALGGTGKEGGRLARSLGFARSLVVYEGQPWRTRAARRHFARFLAPGDLAFDVGAHVGNRTRCFARLGARVVAIEPQPDYAAWLRWRFRRDRHVEVLETALGAAEDGTLALHASALTPTVATCSRPWLDAVSERSGFTGVTWQAPVRVAATSLDGLIARYGRPRFCKIDVEGFEAEVLRGLSRPIPALSLEYLPAAIGVALEAVGVLARLGPYRFNPSIGESLRLVWPDWRPLEAIRQWLAEQRPDARSGDVYARLDGQGRG